jgi:hypothetical protein
MKTFKEYMGGYRIGYVDNITPMVSLGDTPPKGQGGKDSRGVGLHANYTTQGVDTIKPMLTADALKQNNKRIGSQKDLVHTSLRKKITKWKTF